MCLALPEIDSVAHITLMADGYCFGYVLEVAQCLCHFLKISVFTFKLHTPILDQWTTSIYVAHNYVICKFVINTYMLSYLLAQVEK